MKSAEARLPLRHATAYFRVWQGVPEMVLEHGCQGGGIYVVGREELLSIIAYAEALLAPFERNAQEPKVRDRAKK